jgi:hypothetical protein
MGWMRPRSAIAPVVLCTGVFALAACGDDGSTNERGGPTTTTSAPTDDQRFPDVLEVEVERSGDTYDFAVTISSPYDSPERYADGWRIVDPEDGTVYGEHTLLHDHATEQPFTRTQSGVTIPDDVSEVVVEGRDLDYGYGGETVTVTLSDG